MLYDANNKQGPFSPAQSFARGYPLPVVLSPGQGNTVGTIPTFRWSAVDGAAYYKVGYADNELLNRLTIAYTDSASYTPTNALSAAEVYWCVQMVDQDRKPGPVVSSQFYLGHSIFLPLVYRD